MSSARLSPSLAVSNSQERGEGKGQGLPILDRRRRGTTFIDLGVKSVVNSPESTGMGFWSINPYVGCEFGCTYCYARYTHRYVVERAHNAGHISTDELGRFEASNNWNVFERHIFVKQRQATLVAFERDLARICAKYASGTVHPIIIGTATDPYQPAERHFHITRVILERLLDLKGLDLGIITKSPLVCRDVDVLQELERQHQLTVYISLICSDVRIIKLFEARSPMPHARLRALRKLREAHITAGINAAPVLPGITDTSFRIDALVAAARQADALFVHPNVLRIYPSVRDGFLPIIRKHFPTLALRYRSAYRNGREPPSDYITAVQRRFERFAHKYGVSLEDPLRVQAPQQGGREMQLSLL